MKAVLTALLIILLSGSVARAASGYDDSQNYYAYSNHAGLPVSRQPTAQDENTIYAHQLNDLAFQLIRQGSYQEAEGRVRQALQFDPNFVSAHCNLGYIMNKTGRPKEALPHLMFAYKLDPNEPAVLQSLGASYQLMGNFETAISIYNEYLARFPNASDASFISDLITHLKMESANHAIDKTSNAIGIAKTGAAITSETNAAWKKRHVKVYVQPATDVRGYRPSFDVILRNAFLSWSQAGVISFEFTPSRDDADIECIWTDDVKKLASVSEGGETVLKENHGEVDHAKLTLLTTRPGNLAVTDRDVQALCLHEIGHALGLMKHSLDPNDVMFCTLETSHPSARDLQNLKSLYQ